MNYVRFRSLAAAAQEKGGGIAPAALVFFRRYREARGAPLLERSA
jgi:hypothetical protein